MLGFDVSGMDSERSDDLLLDRLGAGAPGSGDLSCGLAAWRRERLSERDAYDFFAGFPAQIAYAEQRRQRRSAWSQVIFTAVLWLVLVVCFAVAIGW
ncbi:MAG: hypothetical protein ACREX8_02045 [Gammaproteobacteria bacterium]